MRVRFANIAAMSVMIALLAIPNLIAQEKTKKDQKSEKANIQGTIQSISKDTSTITVRTTGTITRLVVYNPSTKFRYGHSNDNKPGTLAQVKEMNFISCAGAFDSKSQLMATECVYREAK